MTILKKFLYFSAIIFAFSTLLACKQNSTYSFQGYVEGELVYLSSPYSGTLQTLAVNRGQKIGKGSLVFKLDSEPELSQLNAANNALEQAKSDLADALEGQRNTVLESIEAQIVKAQAELDLADLRVKRFQKLYEKNAIDRDSLDAAITDYQGKLAVIQQLKANLAEAKLGSRQQFIQSRRDAVNVAIANVQQASWALAQKTLIAPTEAMVFDTFYWPGEFVTEGQPVVALLARQYIRFIFFVPEPMLSKIALGDKVQISCDGCEKTYSATITYISPEAEYTPPVIYSRENNYNLVYRIKATPPLDEALLFHPGQPIYVTLIKSKNAL